MPKDQVIIHHNADRKEYFFSTDLLQCSRSKVAYPDGFVSVTYLLPNRVVARPSLPSGVCMTVADIVTIFCEGEKEIANPDAEFQPEFQEG